MKIISIQGPKAVGKTTLINNLRHLIIRGNYSNIEIGPRKQIRNDPTLNLKNIDDFLENQIQYFIFEYERLKKISEMNKEIVILDRGPEDTICFAQAYPRIQKVEWNIDERVPELVQKYIPHPSDLIIFLSADKDTLRDRIQKDLSRDKTNIDIILDYADLEREFFIGLRNSIIINTTKLSKKEVAMKCMALIQEFANTS